MGETRELRVITPGAKAALGGSLAEVIAAAQKAIDNTRSIGVGVSPCTLPAVGHPNFTIEPAMMELGIGHHGEPGLRVVPLTFAPVQFNPAQGKLRVARRVQLRLRRYGEGPRCALRTGLPKSPAGLPGSLEPRRSPSTRPENRTSLSMRHQSA